MMSKARHRNNDMKSSTFNDQTDEYMTDINTYHGKNPSFLHNADQYASQSGKA
jgi:hypothetical protein